ncbi:TPA: hypothetical protein N0F65_005461 [Lagenidium giganteum]|uniref:PLAC8 family protein n=1 Tax=Lagenidium giganteum TaxID=4803 RepID=A0AAV2Z1M1_9STRA|nr:TPA: hypothetical protein N0F65_005461 [Lagenidium giganteum]
MADTATPSTPRAADYQTLESDDKRVDANGITTGAWGAGFYACFDHLVPNCLMAWCYPWVSLAQITSRMGISSYSNALMLYMGLLVGALVLNVLALAYIFCVWQLRGRVRARFEIPGSPLQDLLLSWCCGCCVVAQMASHVKSYEPGSCYCGPVDTLPPYEPIAAPTMPEKSNHANEE